MANGDGERELERKRATNGAPDANVTAKPILGYWALRGLGEPIRLLHAHLGVELEERSYGKPMLPKANRDYTRWAVDRDELAMALPNFPYYLDGDLKLTEAAAIIRYVCEKHAPDMLVAPGMPLLEGKARHDQILTFLFCANNAVRSYHYGFLPQTRSREGKNKGEPTGSLFFKDIWTPEKNIEIAEWAVEQVADAFHAGACAKAISGVDGPLLFGKTPTAADFVLYEHIHLVQCQTPAVANLPQVRLFRKAFEKLPRVSEYLGSGQRVSVPINAPFCRFGASMNEEDPYGPAV